MPDDIDYDPCIICTNPSTVTIDTQSDEIQQNCPRCGNFKVTGTALAMLGQLGSAKRVKLSGWALDQDRAGGLSMIDSNTIEKVSNRPLPSVTERAIRLLKEANYKQTALGEEFNINDPRFLAATYSDNTNDVNFLMKALKAQGLAEYTSLGGNCEISPQGYMQLDQLTGAQIDSDQGFVAMWFDSSLDDVYNNGFHKGIINAGYNPLRIDQHEHVNRIDDEIIAQINVSRFVVADFTGQRSGVYFEAGYALGLGLPVIWSCRQDEMENLHFDIRQFNCIDWSDNDDLANRLERRIRALLNRDQIT